MTTRPAPGALRPSLLAAGVVATMAMASSSVLVHWAAAPAVALAFWRTAGGAVLLGAVAGVGRGEPGRSATIPWAPTVAAGVALGVHFWAWLASLEMTTVAASVTLVSTAPIFVALGRAVAGEDLARRSWLAIVVMFAGGALLTTGGGEAGEGAAHDLGGDALALVGAVTMAIYLELGARVRATVDTTRYAAIAYASAAVVLVPPALVSGAALTGFDRTTWLVIGAMILGPQLAGHTVLNALLQRLGALTVALVLLLEPIGATALAWGFLDQRPSALSLVGVVVVLAGLGLHLAAATGSTEPPGG
ncbi:MAG: DMT family transporter [Acidimicrobiales bacterium]